MIYNVTNDFTAINVTAGTIQNNSYVYPVEVSNQAVANTGYILYPLNKMTFSGTKLYMRCTDGGAFAECRVVPFLVDFGTISQETPSTDTNIATDTEADDIIEAAWSGDYSVSDPDAYNVVDESWNSSSYTDTGDGFSDFLDGLFPH